MKWYGKQVRPRRGGGGDGLGGARSPGETTSLAVALVAFHHRTKGARSPGETTSARVPTPQPNHSRPYGDEGPSPKKLPLSWASKRSLRADPQR